MGPPDRCVQARRVRWRGHRQHDPTGLVAGKSSDLPDKAALPAFTGLRLTDLVLTGGRGAAADQGGGITADGRIGLCRLLITNCEGGPGSAGGVHTLGFRGDAILESYEISLCRGGDGSAMVSGGAVAICTQGLLGM